MTTFTCPQTGRKLVICALVLLSVHCRKNTEPSAWRLTPPTLHWSDERGIAHATPIQSDYRTPPAADAALEFSTADQGLPLSTKSSCTPTANSSGQNIESVTGTTHAQTGQRVLLLRLLPLSLTAPDRLTHGWNCRLEIAVTHPDGNSHTFTIEQFRYPSVSDSQARPLVEFNPVSFDQSIGEDWKLGLACGDWSSNEATGSHSLSISERVGKLMTAPQVQGEDSRALRRRPRCTVIADSAHDRKILGAVTLQLRPPRVSIEGVASLLPAEDSIVFFSRMPVLRWIIKLNDSAPSTLVFPRRLLLSRMISPGVFRTGALKIPYRLEFNGGSNVSHSAQDDRVNIVGGEVITVSMVLDRRLWCTYAPRTDTSEIASVLELHGPVPLTVETLSDLNSPQSAFDQREPVTLLQTMAFVPQPNSPDPKTAPPAAEVRSAPSSESKTDTTACWAGDMFSMDPALSSEHE